MIRSIITIGHALNGDPIQYIYDPSYDVWHNAYTENGTDFTAEDMTLHFCQCDDCPEICPVHDNQKGE